MERKDKSLSSNSTRDRHDASPAKRSHGEITTSEQNQAQSKPESSNTDTRRLQRNLIPEAECCNPDTSAKSVDVDAKSIPEQDGGDTNILGSRSDIRDPTSSQLLDGLPFPGVQYDAKQYNMRHSKRGLAVIFNHYTFDLREYKNGEQHKPANREGTNCDRDSLLATFQNLGFEVECLDDKTYNEIKLKLKQVSCLDHSEHDCLAVAVLTHGEEDGRLDARDREYVAKDLWEPFIATSCASLAGKPKLFFIQACRGRTRDQGTSARNALVDLMDAAAWIPPASFQVPSFADFLISYATFDGMVAFRNANRGSWYVETLCVELNKNGGTKDLVSLLTDVNQMVAQNFNSPDPHHLSTEVLVQVPCFISSLTRRVYFWPKLA